MMINDPHMQACPICKGSWVAHQKNCKYYSRPQHVFTERELDSKLPLKG